MEATIKIQNLKCHGCANTITKNLSALENISEVQVDNAEQIVSFLYKNQVDFEIVIKTLNRLGYPMEGDSNTFTEKAKSFVSCAIGRIG
ncbi:heavy-metal-associated domain-containing protein [Flavobacterium sp.]|uniref:heavy-metal-associated domain-containing protein n=1 Tax=Flavobacterium sp. TaxID=239 RepID=UPI0035281BA3